MQQYILLSIESNFKKYFVTNNGSETSRAENVVYRLFVLNLSIQFTIVKNTTDLKRPKVVNVETQYRICSIHFYISAGNRYSLGCALIHQ